MVSTGSAGDGWGMKSPCFSSIIRMRAPREPRRRAGAKGYWLRAARAGYNGRFSAVGNTGTGRDQIPVHRVAARHICALAAMADDLEPTKFNSSGIFRLPSHGTGL
jgi:hypothetical protein